MPRNLKIHCPAAAKTIRTPAMTQQARRAMRIRCSGVSAGVMARKAGTVANGSTMTKRELAASSVYSVRVIHARRGEAGPSVIALLLVWVQRPRDQAGRRRSLRAAQYENQHGYGNRGQKQRREPKAH